MFLGACKYKGVRFYLTLLFELKNGIFQHISGKIQVPLCQNLCFLSTCILPEIAILAFEMSSQVKFDPVDLTGSKRQSWSQNLRSLSQKTKKRGNNAVTRRFGKYSFQDKQTQKQMIRPKGVKSKDFQLLYIFSSIFVRRFILQLNQRQNNS